MSSESGSQPLILNGDTGEQDSGAKSPNPANDRDRKATGTAWEGLAVRSSHLSGSDASHKIPMLKQAPVIDTTKDLSALVSRQMRATPDAIALEDETVTLTYSELDQRVTLLARRLRDHGVGRDSLVGVLLGRSANYVISCLAALRAGGAFLVLELAYPPSLLADVIEDAKPVVIITNTAQANQIDANIPLIIFSDLGMGYYKPTEGQSEVTALPADDDLERLAFVSYSSGTTVSRILDAFPP
jgi:non-ribosomal peptide synthetase component F